MSDYPHLITEIPDFPAPGVLFREISPLLADITARDEILEKIGNFIQEKNIEVIAGIDARGFIIGSLLAQKYHLPFVMIRKEGKLPKHLTIQESYSYEYSEATLTVRSEFLHGKNVLVVDDVLATGGTLAAALRLAQRSGAREVSGAVLLELTSLGWREKLSEFEIFSAIQYT
jgi:adenine phosphoribosyltransferase